MSYTCQVWEVALIAAVLKLLLFNDRVNGWSVSSWVKDHICSFQ